MEVREQAGDRKVEGAPSTQWTPSSRFGEKYEICAYRNFLLPEWTRTRVRGFLVRRVINLSLSSAARHIDFHSLRRIYVAFSACHSAFTTIQYYTRFMTNSSVLQVPKMVRNKLEIVEKNCEIYNFF